MGFIVLKCPSCTADIQLDENREFGFCQYCGTKITQDIQKVNITVENEVKVQGISTVDNLLIRAKQFLNEKQYSKSMEYIDKILDIDATNQSANNLKREIQFQSEREFQTQELIKQAKSLLSIGNENAAKKIILKAVQLNPSHKEVLQLKETIEKKAKNYKVAGCVLVFLEVLICFICFMVWVFSQ